MNKRCSVCNHPSRVEIDRGLLNGVSYRALAAPYGLSPSSLCRHTRHLQQQMDLHELHAHREAQKALLEQLELLSLRLDRLYHTASSSHSLYVALGALRESLRLHFTKNLHERFRLSPPPGP
ncbi:MAG: hypothetical protein HY790_01345 [Deltaproteobacteria bacterium]|nr:hypothetical protein [Deltaproteobacteria bacterium]